jgi:superfamily I DNA and/or RNA helicase
LLEQIVAAGAVPDLYVVTPFVQVADGLRRLLRESALLRGSIADLDSWVHERVGTIHTVQGREAQAVIFVLGAPNADQIGARAWAGKEPNLLNVAVTRAKEALYVIGNRMHWQSAGYFKELSEHLPASL